MRNLGVILLVIGLCGWPLAPPGGAWATTILYYGSGDCLRIYDNSTYGNRAKFGGGIVGITIDGANATGAATGLHVGDLLQYEVDLTVQNFKQAGSIGVHLDNNYYWTEQLFGRIYAQRCASHVVFDWTSGTATTSSGSARSSGRTTGQRKLTAAAPATAG